MVQGQESLVENSTVGDLDTVAEIAENPKVDALEAEEVDEILDFDAASVSEVANNTDNDAEPDQSSAEPVQSSAEPVQSGPFIDLFGPTLLSLKMIDETRAQIVSNFTSDVLRGKSVVGVYFSADW